jgi:hypothetical protein
MILLVWSLAAHGASLDEVQARVDEIAPLRAQRISQGVPTLGVEHYERAVSGQVSTDLRDVPGHKARKVLAVGIVDAPIDQFWAAINHDLGKVDYSKLAYAEVLSGGVCGANRRVFQYLDVSMATDRWWVFDVVTNAAVAEASGGQVREMTWKSRDSAGLLTASATAWAEKGMQIEFTEGSWFLVALDEGHTLVEYYAWSDPGGMVPAGLASSFAGGAVPDLFAAMQQFAKAGPGC